MVVLQILGKLRDSHSVNSVIGTHPILFGLIKPKPYHKSRILILQAPTSKANQDRLSRKINNSAITVKTCVKNSSCDFTLYTFG
jgi:hypothetical protein